MSVKSLIPSTLKSAVIDFLADAGFELRYRAAPVDFRGLLDNPADAIHRSGGNPVLIDVELSACRGMTPLCFACTKSAGHPFIDTAQGILDGSVTEYVGSPLEKYYKRCQPGSLSELLGLGDADTGPAANMPPNSFIYPWAGIPSLRQSRNRIRSLTGENRHHSALVSGDYGWHSMGPVSIEKGILEFNRLSKLLFSVKESGYQRNNGPDGDVCGVALVNDDEFVVTISPGQHRVAAAATLGYKYIPVRLGTKPVPVVYRSDAEKWPAVQSGFLTVEQAVAFFDRVFEGQGDNRGCVLSPPPLVGDVLQKRLSKDNSHQQP